MKRHCSFDGNFDWIKSSFDDISCKKKTTNQLRNPTNLTTKRINVNEDFLTQFAPRSIKELAVHTRKVGNVQQCLRDAINKSITQKKATIILLSGPSGCGKTATIRVLAKELGCGLIEWTSHSRVSVYSSEDNALSVGESENRELHEFLFRTGRYSALDPDAKSSSPQIVLLEEIPSSILTDSNSMRGILNKYSIHGRWPLLLISSETSVQQSLQRLLAENQLRGIVISFNAIAPTILTRVLTNFALQNSKLSSDQNLIREIASFANGDIRQAIRSFQLTSVSSKTPHDKSVLRDTALGRFHALGKILYTKRISWSETKQDKPLLPDHLSIYDRESLIEDPENLIERSQMTTSQLLLALQHNYIPTCTSDLDEISRVSDYLAHTDFHTWSQTHDMMSLSLAVRGIQHIRKSAESSRNQWRPLYGSPHYSTFNEAKQLKNTAAAHFRSFLRSWSESDIWCELLPMCAVLSNSLNLTSEQKELLFKVKSYKASQIFKEDGQSDEELDNISLSTLDKSPSVPLTVNSKFTVDDDELIIEEFDSD